MPILPTWKIFLRRKWMIDSQYCKSPLNATLGLFWNNIIQYNLQARRTREWIITNVYCLIGKCKVWINDSYELASKYVRWASFIFQIKYQSSIPILYSEFIRVFVPRTTIPPCPFQQLKVTIGSSVGACPYIPWASIRPSPFQQLKVTIEGSIGACQFIPWTLVCPAPFQ